MEQLMISAETIQAEKLGDDLVRLIGFASEKIMSIERVNDRQLSICLEDGTDAEEVLSQIDRMLKHRQSSSEEKVIFQIGSSEGRPFHRDIPETLMKNYNDGLIALRGEAIELLEYLDKRFKQIALEMSAIETQYPTLLPLGAMRRTGYLRTSPQYSMFVSHPTENVDDLMGLSKEAEEGRIKNAISEPHLVLSPAACFHCYMDLEHSQLEKPSIYTFRQKVFRHEGRMNWDSFGRLRDYHVREIVFFGDEQFVREHRSLALEKVKQLAEELKLIVRGSVTCDPFVVPSMQKFKKIQLEEESKIEFQLAYGADQYLAGASFNLHGTAFTNPFEIAVKEIDQPVTGCIGFGLERWVLCFMAQHGTDPGQWKEILH
ncbi:hypothetical protein KIH86_13490 [Paenibacillus sp. HN-1]|uniref:hypothetical protein n=1 Tax=Paenibacillus TaxID=44249 RepID=UPI001CA8507F|nr:MULTISPECIES: hypothetical protein [Paenibacillus]MBY9080767.1 hypothetical protein [Paenibacillus sp. CGMCC 1.18879]MBY9085241.1 hypothetical protein [Paenibacillus sinensis]